VSLFSGLYPAFILSSYQPAVVLKGANNSGKNIGVFRKSLILVQFIFSSIMILATLLVNDQVDFINSKKLGFDKENVLTLRLPTDSTINRKSQVFIDEIKRSPSILAVSRSSMPTGSTGELMFRVEIDKQMVERTVKTIFVDYDFIDVLGLQLIQGRNFSKDFSTDLQQAFIVNQKASELFGWNEEAIGKRIQWGLMPNAQAVNDGRVVGTINDFHFLSLHNEMEPIILCLNTFGSQNLSVKLAPNRHSQTLDFLQKKWQEMADAYPFDPIFLSDRIKKNYDEEKNMQRVFKFFSMISIVVASMGLFAMLSYSIENREKEIGVRKILGASTLNVTWIVAREFLIILILAFCISAPLTFIGIQYWLQAYAYKSPIQWQSFILSLFIIISMSILAVSYHSFRLSIKNPLQSLQKD
jgi:putative ABC transport system permease protein